MNFIENERFMLLSDQDIINGGFLSNFQSWLPDREGVMNVVFAEMAELADRRIGEVLEDLEQYVGGCSERYLSLTYREFAELVASVVVECGIDINYVFQLQAKRRMIFSKYNSLPSHRGNTNQHDALQEESKDVLNELLLLTIPVARRLLEEGFSIRDFTG